MNAAGLFARPLEAEGIEHVFGTPGEENVDRLGALRHSRQVRLVLTRHEQAAGFMVATYGRLTGKTGGCAATLGAGVHPIEVPMGYAGNNKLLDRGLVGPE